MEGQGNPWLQWGPAGLLLGGGAVVVRSLAQMGAAATEMGAAATEMGAASTVIATASTKIAEASTEFAGAASRIAAALDVSAAAASRIAAALDDSAGSALVIARCSALRAEDMQRPWPSRLFRRCPDPPAASPSMPPPHSGR